jgi:hypothetical protein
MDTDPEVREAASRGGDMVVETPAEPTVKEIAGKVELLCNAVGVLLLVLGQYPIPRDLVVRLVKECGVEFDEAQAFRPKSVILAPGMIKGN